MYLIKGEDDYLINKKIEEIIQKESSLSNQQIEIIKFYDFFSLDNLSDALNNEGLFFNKKIIIFKNPFIFNQKNKLSSKLINDFITLIKDNINENEYDNVIIFSQEIFKYDKNFLPSLAFNFIDRNSKIIEIPKISEKNLFSFVFNMIKEKKGKISDRVLISFLSTMPNNLSLIESEINKLLLINKEISQQMVDDNNFSLSNNLEFALHEALLKFENPRNIIKKINEQLQYGIDGNSILLQISSTLANAKNIAILKKMNITNDEISKIINIHPYRVKLHYEFYNKISEKKLNSLIKEISKIDIEFKKGNINADLLIDLILISIIK
ncbi:DNA polymerase III subunit delta [Metamycoplasma canadense]|uniref:DNA polymerase III subunit delta n=1 Tax=Metamycoplasma canadense TaxID=29554 RepID=A0A077L5N6_9BACT|nr:hypothetical protein [Metamycoplasma canadense]BAP39327.1 DNA polymerase III [Metamycoplasma canadense]